MDEPELSQAELRETLASADEAESQTYAYDCTQFFAPCDDGPPSYEELVPVRCRELSAHSVSILWPEEPPFQRVVVSLGSGAKLVFMEAKVATAKCIYLHGKLQYCVRCEFLARASEFTRGWHARPHDHDAECPRVSYEQAC